MNYRYAAVYLVHYNVIFYCDEIKLYIVFGEKKFADLVKM